MTKMDELVKQINKDAKEEIISLGLNAFDYSRIPFTSPKMNYCTYGGLPVGKLIEFYGEEHGGKTTTALDIVANYQHGSDSRKVLYVDAENTLDYEWAKKLGVNIDDVYVLQPKAQSAEEIFQIICDAIETDEIGLWVLDSIGVLLSRQEWDKTLEDKTYGGISMALTKFSKRVEVLMHAHKCTGIGINQVRDVIGSMFPMQTTPGGKAWKHCCSVRMEFRRGSFFDEQGNLIKRSSESPAGNIVEMSMTKNKSCPANRRLGTYKLNYTTGIDYVSDLIDLAIKYDIIIKKGAWFSIINTATGDTIQDKIQGQSNLHSILTDDKNVNLLEMIESLINQKIF